jgi:hypothetical protein
MSDKSIAPTPIIPGDDFHLTLLMAPMGLNFVTGSDRRALLEYAKAAWQASRKVALTQAMQAAGPQDSYQDEHFAAKADSVNKIKELLKHE